MKKPFLPVTKVIFTTLAGISFASLVMTPPSLAQLGSVDSNSSTDLQNNNDPFGLSNNGNFDMMELMHRANFGNINWNAEQQSQKLDSTAAEFRAKQQEIFQVKQQPTPAVITLPASSENSDK